MPTELTPSAEVLELPLSAQLTAALAERDELRAKLAASPLHAQSEQIAGLQSRVNGLERERDELRVRLAEAEKPVAAQVETLIRENQSLRVRAEQAVADLAAEKTKPLNMAVVEQLAKLGVHPIPHEALSLKPKDIDAQVSQAKASSRMAAAGIPVA